MDLQSSNKNIDQDPWLMNEGLWITIGVIEELKGRRVFDIIIENGSWKEDIIKDSFLPDDADIILSMPRSKKDKDDEIIWGRDSRGTFSVKGTYPLASQLEGQSKASGSDYAPSKRLWQSI